MNFTPAHSVRPAGAALTEERWRPKQFGAANHKGAEGAGMMRSMTHPQSHHRRPEAASAQPPPFSEETMQTKGTTWQ